MLWSDILGIPCCDTDSREILLSRVKELIAILGKLTERHGCNYRGSRSWRIWSKINYRTLIKNLADHLDQLQLNHQARLVPGLMLARHQVLNLGPPHRQRGYGLPIARIARVSTKSPPVQNSKQLHR